MHHTEKFFQVKVSSFFKLKSNHPKHTLNKIQIYQQMTILPLDKNSYKNAKNKTLHNTIIIVDYKHKFKPNEK